ncbi:MAG: peptidyl-prolyl cis-trans isomerase [Acidobacteriota bacterium]
MKKHWIKISLVGVLALVLVGLFLSRQRQSQSPKPETSQLAYLPILSSNQVLAKVGGVEIRGTDVRDALQTQFHGNVTHTALSSEDLAKKVEAALNKVVEDELLAQEAVARGMKPSPSRIPARSDLAEQLVSQELATLPPLSEQELRSFYKNHGEKFYIPPGNEVRELFLPLQGEDESAKKDKAYLLGLQLAERIRRGESIEALADEHSPESAKPRAKPHLFRGGVMDLKDELTVVSLAPGEVCDPLRVEGGYSVFQGIRQERSRLIPFREAKEKIQEFLEARRSTEVRRRLVEQLQKKTRVERFNLEPAVAQLR